MSPTHEEASACLLCLLRAEPKAVHQPALTTHGMGTCEFQHECQAVHRSPDQLRKHTPENSVLSYDLTGDQKLYKVKSV